MGLHFFKATLNASEKFHEILLRTYGYQGVGNVRFSKNFAPVLNEWYLKDANIFCDTAKWHEKNT